MPGWGVALVALACLVGIAGTIVPVLPGSLVVGAAVVLWAIVEGGVGPWVVAALAVAVLGLGALLKYLVPGRRLAAAGVPGRILVVGGVVGVAGFFLVPVVGLPLGFVGGVFLAEWARLRDPAAAWPSTVHAMKAAGLSMLIELAAALVATSIWAAGVVLLPG